MDPNNPIFLLAARALAGGFDENRFLSEAYKVLFGGITEEHEQEAWESLQMRIDDVGILDYTAQFLAIAALGAGQHEAVASYFWRLANTCDQCSDGDSLQIGASLYKQFRLLSPNDKEACARALAYEGITRLRLADLGVAPQLQLEEAVRLHERARAVLPPLSSDYGISLMSEGVTRVRLAELGVTPQIHLETAILRQEDARRIFDPASPSYGRTLGNEGTARARLAQFGVEPRLNLEAAARLFAAARRYFESNSDDFAMGLMNEGNVLHGLAELEIEAGSNLRQAIDLQREARSIFDPESNAYGSTLMHEGIAHQSLAALGKDPEANLQQAVDLHQQARQVLGPSSPTYGRAQVNEGLARLDLAERGVSPHSNSQEAELLCDTASALLEAGTSDWGKARRYRARALRHLDRAKESHRCLVESLDVLERMRGSFQAERERVSFQETVAGTYAEMVGLCLELSKAETNFEQQESYRWEALYWVHQAKGRVLREMLTDVSRSEDLDASLWEEYDRRKDELTQADRVLKQLFESPDSPLRQTRGEELASDHLRSLEQYVEERNAVWKHLSGEQGLTALNAPEPKSTAVRFRELASGINRPLGAELFVLGRDRAVVFLLPGWGEVEPSLEVITLKLPDPYSFESIANIHLQACQSIDGRRDFRNFESEKGGSSRTRHSGLAARASMLDTLVILGQFLTPLLAAAQQRNATELILSPSGLLNLLPLHAALVDSSPLISRLPVTYFPTFSLAGELLGSCPSENRGRGKALILGNPHCGLNVIRHGDSCDLLNLPGAHLEARDVSVELETNGLPTILYYNREASQKHVQKHAEQLSIVHYAGHSLSEWSDFLRSGMELSDSRLMVFDLMYRFRFPNGVFACLSSCESGQAVPGRTDELQALARAFFHSGIPSVMATLWSVTDIAAREFAVEFYKFWLESPPGERGRTLAEAFREATLALYNAHVDEPEHWSPFVLVGIWHTRFAGLGTALGGESSEIVREGAPMEVKPKTDGKRERGQWWTLWRK